MHIDICIISEVLIALSHGVDVCMCVLMYACCVNLICMYIYIYVYIYI